MRRTHAIRWVVLLTVLLCTLALAACVPPAPETDRRVGPETSTEETPTQALTQTYDGDAVGAEIAYPEGWVFEEGDEAAASVYFHPEPFDLPEATEVFGVAVQIRLEPIRFDDVVGGAQMGQRIISEEDTRVAERRTVIVEMEASGDMLLPEGVRSYRYYVDREGETLVGATFDVGDLDYERNKLVLDEMMSQITLPGDQ